MILYATLLAVLLPRAASALTPRTAVHDVADHILNATPGSVAGAAFRKWGYGQSIIVDALLLAAEEVDGMEHAMGRWVNPVLDGFLATEGSAAYNLTHGLPISAGFIGNAVGDKIGLYPHAYLHRYVHYTQGGAKAKPPPKGYNASADLAVARTALDEYVLTWPLRWTDGTVTRDFQGCSNPMPWRPPPRPSYSSISPTGPSMSRG